MSDKLDWLNRHYILFEHKTVVDAVNAGVYQVPPFVLENFGDVNSCEVLIGKLDSMGKQKEACDLMAGIMHKRAAIWWGYRCMLDLLEELAQVPENEASRDNEKQAAEELMPEGLEVPPVPISQKEIEEFFENQKKALERIEELKAQIPDEIKQLFDKAFAEINAKIKKEAGQSPLEVLEETRRQYDDQSSDDGDADVDVPIESKMKKVKEEIAKHQKEMMERIKSVFPEVPPSYTERITVSAYDAVWSWIAVPNEANSQRCLKAGNELPKEPIGLLALSAFWSFGNVSPNPEVFVPTPAGLPGKGLSNFLVKCALQKGGTKDFNERYKTYLQLGLEVASGRSTWADDVAKKRAPHAPYMNFKASDAEELGQGRFRQQPAKDVY